jgi:TRAP-type uncharacterized transport system substrate-binding protein
VSWLGANGRVYALAVLVLVLVVGIAVAYQFVQPAPPDRLVMATGPEGGAYRG